MRSCLPFDGRHEATLTQVGPEIDSFWRLTYRSDQGIAYVWWYMYILWLSKTKILLSGLNVPSTPFGKVFRSSHCRANDINTSCRIACRNEWTFRTQRATCTSRLFDRRGFVLWHTLTNICQDDSCLLPFDRHCLFSWSSYQAWCPPSTTTLQWRLNSELVGKAQHPEKLLARGFCPVREGYTFGAFRFSLAVVKLDWWVAE